MSNLTLRSRPAWGTDRWLREFFGPAAAADWAQPVSSGFTPAAEIVKDGDDAVVRVELPGVEVEKDVKVEVDKGRLVIHGEHRDEHSEVENGRALREIRARGRGVRMRVGVLHAVLALRRGEQVVVLVVRVRGVMVVRVLRVVVAHGRCI